MPNYSNEKLAKFRESWIYLNASESAYADLVDDLIAARARIAELEGALGPFAELVKRWPATTPVEYIITAGIPIKALRRAAAALKGQSNEP